MQQPRESELRRRNSKLGGYLSQHSTGRRQRRSVLHRVSPQWTIRQEEDSLARTEIDDWIMLAFRHAVTILNGGNCCNRLSFFDLIQRDVGEPNPANLALLLQRCQGSHRFGKRSIRVNPMQLIKIDAIKPQILQTLLAVTPETFQAGVKISLGCGFLDNSALSRNEKIVRIGMQRVGDYFCVPPRPISPSRVNEPDAQRRKSRFPSSQSAYGPKFPGWPVKRIAPYPKRGTVKPPLIVNVSNFVIVLPMLSSFISLRYPLQVGGAQCTEEDCRRSFRLFFWYEVSAFGDHLSNDIGRRLSDCSCQIKSGRG